MNIFKTKFIYYIVALSVLFTSCGSGSDEDDPVTPPVIEPGTPVDLTLENIVGEWEIGYFLKKVGNAATQRGVETDGFKIVFTDQPGTKTGYYKYMEYNSIGESNLLRGDFMIMNEDSIRLDFRYKDLEGVVKDSITALNISDITTKIIIREQEYDFIATSGITRRIVDRQYLRNTRTAPNETFGFTKEKFTLDFFKGKWKLQASKEYVDNVENTNYDPSAFIGATLTFANDYSFIQMEPDGVTESSKGQIVIIDDAVHYYYKGKNSNNEEVDAMTAMWIKKVPGMGDSYFEHYKHTIYFEGSKTGVIELRTIYKKE